MPGRFAEAVSNETARAEARTRALVLLPDVKPTGPFDHLAGLRANFLAHLIATRDRSPQTTILRRVAPDVAVVAYGARDPDHVVAKPSGVKSRLA
jgi:hypothetical protein